MITNVDVIGPQGNVLSLPIKLNPDGYQFKKLTGLNPIKANLITSDLAGQDGQYVHDTTRSARSMILYVDLVPQRPEDTVASLRRKSYQYFMTESRVTLSISSDDFPTLTIDAIVEDSPNEVFSEDNTIAITLFAPQPDFIDTTEVNLDGMTVSDFSSVEIDYPGTVETGFDFRIDFPRDVAAISVYSQTPGSVLQVMELNGDFKAGDTLLISTRANDKYAELIRNGVQSSILNWVSDYANWMKFYPGINFGRVYAEGDPMEFNMRFTPKYGAI